MFMKDPLSSLPSSASKKKLLIRQSTSPSSMTNFPSAPPSFFKPRNTQNSGERNDLPVSAPSAPCSAKETLLLWTTQQINHYDRVKVTNFSSSWSDGLAFCALIHVFYPEAFDFSSLDPQNRHFNFSLAFQAAEKYGDIFPLLDVEDMVKMKTPDWKCVFTYVQSFYRRFRNGRELQKPTKENDGRDTPTRSLIKEMESSAPLIPKLRRQLTLPAYLPSKNPSSFL